ncbi:MAG: L,D-transpeptidase [Nocardiopsaceae bacterium]|nr:L,D-transpeptidase [Nocardiopsaceae bacterium]
MRRAATLLTVAVASVGVLAAVFGLSRSGLVARWAGTRLAATSLSAHAGPAHSPGAAHSKRPAHAKRAAHPKPSDPGPSNPAGFSYNRLAWSAGMAGLPASRPPSLPLPLTRAQRRACPASASACADLKGHLAWLQSAGKVTYGPVRMEPGAPGTRDATPRGTFHVQWKAGPGFVSSEYHDPMPWATFFATGGIAFHGGSLTETSHGCVHLTTADARYFQAHLPIGAEVVVF